MNGLAFEELGGSARERTLLRRVGLLVGAAVVGATLGAGAFTWAESRVGAVGDRVNDLERRVDRHETEQKRLPDTLAAMDGKLELLLEDCHRRGGCQRR